uniref:Venom protein n=1 Tax=Haemonchus contortus TaxID=6289 RepID=A0A7I4Z2I8_HAECO
MRSTFLLSVLLIFALFSYSTASTLCVKLIEKAAYAPGVVVCSFFAPGFMKPICSNMSRIRKEIEKGTAYDEICKIIGFDD